MAFFQPELRLADDLAMACLSHPVFDSTFGISYHPRHGLFRNKLHREMPGFLELVLSLVFLVDSCTSH